MATIRMGRGTVQANGTVEADVITGNELDNIIYGGAGADVIDGGAGADIIYGDDPCAANFADTVSYAASGDSVFIDLNYARQFGGDAQGDELYSIENLIGSAFDDFLTGNNVRNIFDAGKGNDRLSGGIDGFADILDGGAGVDSVDYRYATSAMTVALDQTTTFVTQFGVFTRSVDGSATTSDGVVEDIIRNMENVFGSDYNDRLTGNERANHFDGGLGADTINGMGGIDTVEYGRFFGTIYLDRSGPVAHTDINRVDIDLLRSVQHGSAAEGDVLISIENISASMGHDILKGTDVSNRIEGGRGDDVIFGRGGDDFILAGSGFDTLDGGAGSDVFIYGEQDFSASMAETRYGRHRPDYGIDIIVNFETGKDRIDLSAIDAIRGNAGSDAFIFTEAFSGVGGQLVYDGSVLSCDVDGDKIADLQIKVSGLQRSDVIL